MAELKDSGERREFDTGAVRDIAEGKGRCDLLPLEEVGYFMADSDDGGILIGLGRFLCNGNESLIISVIDAFIKLAFGGDEPTAMLELAKHYEDGARKYSDRNWEKGIPCHCYVDSGVRHYLKWKRGDKDEPHDRAFLWNMFGLLWTLHNKPELNDLPFAEKEDPEKT